MIHSTLDFSDKRWKLDMYLLKSGYQKSEASSKHCHSADLSFGSCPSNCSNFRLKNLCDFGAGAPSKCLENKGSVLFKVPIE